MNIERPNPVPSLDPGPLHPASDYHVMVLLVDDQAMVCEAVRRTLSSQSDMDFHYCADAREALTVAEHVKPTVILQDLVMPGIDGLTLVGSVPRKRGHQGRSDHCAFHQRQSPGQRPGVRHGRQ